MYFLADLTILTWFVLYYALIISKYYIIQIYFASLIFNNEYEMKMILNHASWEV